MDSPKFVFSADKRAVTIDGTVAQYLEYYASRPAVSIPGNLRMFEKNVYSDESKIIGFAGGTAAAVLERTTDFTRYEQAKERLNQSGIMDLLKESSDQVKRRARTRSAYDGEWDLDRKWDVEPFINRQVLERSGRVVNLDVHAAFSWQVPAAAINDFCTFLAALVELIESRGVMIRLRMINEATGNLESGPLDVRMTTLIKESDQYFSAGELLQVMSCNYYRRVYFMAKVMCAEQLGKTIASDLGYPVQHPLRSAVNAETSTLSLYSMPHPNEQVQVLEQLITLIKEGK